MVVDAKKSLGQHWLNDPDSLINIINAADLNENDTVLEIGPGKGSLTTGLCKKAKKVVAVELDVDLIHGLNKLEFPNLTVINQDILTFNLNSLEPGYKIVANIPYYLTSKLIRQISETGNRAGLVILLVQKEIAERLSAKPGNMSILGLTCQYFWDVSALEIVPASKFSPLPKVDSQIVRLIPKSPLLLTKAEEKRLFQLIRIGFSSKRKTLINNLSSGYRIDKDKLAEPFSSMNLDPKIRPQNLSLSQWLELLEYVSGLHLG